MNYQKVSIKRIVLKMTLKVNMSPSLTICRPLGSLIVFICLNRSRTCWTRSSWSVTESPGVGASWSTSRTPGTLNSTLTLFARKTYNYRESRDWISTCHRAATILFTTFWGRTLNRDYSNCSSVSTPFPTRNAVSSAYSQWASTSTTCGPTRESVPSSATTATCVFHRKATWTSTPKWYILALQSLYVRTAAKHLPKNSTFKFIYATYWKKQIKNSL